MSWLPTSDAPESPALPARRSLLTTLLPAVLLLALGAFLLRFLHRVTPLDRWFCWDLLRLWGWQLLLATASASAGHLLIGPVLRLPAMPALERWALAGPAGLVVFAAGMYGAGYLGLYGPWWACLWPLSLIAAGATTLWPQLRELQGRWRRRPPASALAVVATAYGAVCLAIVYLGLLSPHAINYDATWMHVTIAQDYAREGRIVPFVADWVKSVPHLASVLYTWGFLVPGFEHPAQRWMMALHTEMAALAWTLVGVAAAVRWLAGEARVRGAFVAFFLFPALFVYDSNLGGAADHVAAMFAAPLLLATARLLPHARGPRWVLLGWLAGGALLTKLQTGYVVAPLAVALLVALARAALRPAAGAGPRWTLLAWPLAGVACALALLGLHLGKSWVHHDNPFHPFLQDLIPSRPTVADAGLQVSRLLADWQWRAPSALGERLRSAAEVTATFAFVPHYSFVANRPIFGPLFSLLLLVLPLARAGRRLWLGAAVALGMIFLWAATYRVDRNLQIFLPVLAAVTGALLWKLWQLGPPTRVALAGLVGVQVLWSAGVMFSSSDRLASAMTLVNRSDGESGKPAARYADFRPGHLALTKALPPEAVVLLHNLHPSLGLDRRVLLDWMGFQGAIDYRTMTSARDVDRRFRELGVTHIVTGPDSVQPGTRREEVLFSAFLTHAKPVGHFHGLVLHAMPDQPPPPPVAGSPLVLALGVPGHADGVYRLEDLSTGELFPPELRLYPKPRRPLRDLEEIWSALGEVVAALIGAGTPLDPVFAERLQRELPKAAAPSRLAVHLRPGWDPPTATSALETDGVERARGRRRRLRR